MLTKLEIQLYSIVHTLSLRHKEHKHKINAMLASEVLILCPIRNRGLESMDDSSYRRNFDQDKKNEIHYHSWKEHLKMRKNTKFGCELL